MSCITAKVTRASEPCDVKIDKTEGIGVVVMAAVSAITAAVTFVSSLIVKATHIDGGVNTEIALERGINVEVGIICTVKLSDEIEMWWCEGWTALWNNKLKILWRGESV